MARVGRWHKLSFLLLAGACGFEGCGGTPTAEVAGAVTLKGEPVGGANLVFTSTTNSDDLFLGASSRDGNYNLSYRELKGLPAGRYKVTITIQTLPGGAPFVPVAGAEEMEGNEKLRPVSFVFEKEIAAGPIVINFELSEGQKL